MRDISQFFTGQRGGQPKRSLLDTIKLARQEAEQKSPLIASIGKTAEKLMFGNPIDKAKAIMGGVKKMGQSMVEAPKNFSEMIGSTLATPYGMKLFEESRQRAEDTRNTLLERAQSLPKNDPNRKKYLDMANKVQTPKMEDFVDLLKYKPKEVVATAGETALSVLPFARGAGAGLKATEATAKGLIGKAALEGAGYGAGFGALEEVGKGEQPTFSSVAKQAGVGAAAGAIMGGGTAGITAMMRGKIKGKMGLSVEANKEPFKPKRLTSAELADEVRTLKSTHPAYDVKTTKYAKLDEVNPNYEPGVDLDRNKIEELKNAYSQGEPIKPIYAAKNEKTGKLDIFDGRNRYTAAQELGIKDIPVIEANPPKGLTLPDLQKAPKTTKPEPLTEELGGAQASAENINNKYAASINLDRLDTTPEGKKILENTIYDIKPELEKITGRPVTHEELKNEVKKAIMLRDITSRSSQVEEMASALKAREKLTTLSNEISQIEAKGEKVPSNKILEQVNLIKIVNNYANAQGRGLNALAVQAKDKPLKEELIGKLTSLGFKTQEVAAAAEKVDWQNAKSVAEFYRSFVKPSMNEIIDEYRYVNMLASPKTQITNILGNALQIPLSTAEKLASGGLDYIGSTLTGKQRQHYASEVSPYAKGMVNSLPEAWDNMLKAIRGELTIGRPDVGTVSRMPTATKGVRYYYNTVLRFMEGADIFFKTMFTNAEKETLAYRFSKQGQKVSDATLTALAEPMAKYRIFRQPLGEESQGALLKAIDKATANMYVLRNIEIGGVRPLSWFVPFVETPMNILKQGIEYSPAGLATIPGASDKTAQLAKAVVGSTVFSGAGWLAFSGKTTWAPPSGEKERAAFYASGRKPYSIQVGDKWISYSKLGPLAYPVAMAAALKEYSQDNGMDKTTSERVLAYLGGMSKFFADQSYLEGIRNLMALSSSREGEAVNAWQRAGTSLVKQAIPLSSIQGFVARMIDDVYREPKNAKEQIMAQTPWLSKQLAPYKTPDNKESKRSLNILNAFSPFEVSEASPQGERYYQQYEKELNIKRQKASRKKAIEEKYGSAAASGSSSLTGGSSTWKQSWR